MVKAFFGTLLYSAGHSFKFGHDTKPQTDVEVSKMWKVKAEKAMFVLTVPIEDEFLQQLKNAKTPKEAWDTFSTTLTTNNYVKLQSSKNRK